MRCDPLLNSKRAWQLLEPAATSTSADCSKMVSWEVCVEPTSVDPSWTVESSFSGFLLLVFSSVGTVPEGLCPSIPADLHNAE